MSTANATRLQTAARRHLWQHFTHLRDENGDNIPILARGDGCYVEDIDGVSYLDALAGLFTVNIGYSYGAEIGAVAAAQLAELPYHTNWFSAHPRSIELAERIASLAPPGMQRVFFTSGGSEAVESAWKLARQYHHQRGEHRWKAIARRVAYHGTTLGALSLTGIDGARDPFLPLVPGVVHVSNTNRYHRPAEETEEQFTLFLLDELEREMLAADPSTIAMVILELLQNGGGAFTPPVGYLQGVRALCDRFGILLCIDEVITAFGRLGAWFASERYAVRPDILTCAKGLSSAYAPIGAVVASEEVAEPFLAPDAMFAHGLTFGGHPVSCAIALKNIEIMEREGLIKHVDTQQHALKAALAQLLELPIVGDLRGTGYFYALELVKDKETRETFDQVERDVLLRDLLSPLLFERGLICRADDRGDPVVTISPPLVAGQAEFDRIAEILGDGLAEASKRLDATLAARR
jgi:adenosylmethionine-8-amino-7-oxononanoate aminotransferase